MPEQDPGTGEMEHGDEVLDVSFPARDEPTKVVEPSEESFDLPSTLHTADAASILCRLPPAPPMWSDHLDAVIRHERTVEAVAIVAAVADQARREVREEASVERSGDEVRLIQ